MSALPSRSEIIVSPPSSHGTGATLLAIMTVSLLVFYITACSKEPNSTPDNKGKQKVDSTQAAERHLRRRVHNMKGIAVVAIEKDITRATFRKGAIQGKVGIVMTDGRVEVMIRSVLREPYHNPYAKVPTADHAYDVLYTVTNRGNSIQVLDAVEGLVFSQSSTPVIRTMAYYYDNTYNVSQLPTELAAGEFEEFHISTMGREGTLHSVGIMLKYQDMTESRFLVPVSLNQIMEKTR